MKPVFDQYQCCRKNVCDGKNDRYFDVQKIELISIALLSMVSQDQSKTREFEMSSARVGSKSESGAQRLSSDQTRVGHVDGNWPRCLREC